MSFSQMTTAAFSPGRKMSRSYLQPPGDFGTGAATSESNQGRTGVCVHNWTSPVTFRSEQPTPVTHFAITCETSTASSKKQISPNLLSLSFLASFSTSERSPSTPYRTSSDGINITLCRPHCWLITRRRDLARSHPDIDVEHKIRVESDNKRCA